MPPCYRSKFRGGFSIRKITSSASLYIEQRSTTLQHDCSAISLAQFGVAGKDIGYCVGNDSAWYSNVANQCYFNPRSRVGNDLQWFVLGLIELLFQSTFPRGERRDAAFTKVFADNFNPRSRVGNDVRGSVYRLSFANFNPRSRVGND